MKPKQPARLNRSLRLSNEDKIKLTSKLINLKKYQTVKSITNKIINQNIVAAVKYLPEKFVDLLFIDPPYNLTKRFNNTAFREMKNDKYEEWLESWLSSLTFLLKDTASIYICGDWKSSSAIFNVGSRFFKVRNRITWEREKGRGASANWKNCTEDIWFFTKSDKYTFNKDQVKQRRKVLAPYKDDKGKPKDWTENSKGKFRDTHPSNIWNDISIPFWSMPENTEHPTQKPEKLLAKIILASSKVDDIVFDPFLGSGTTAVVAKKLNRKFVGVEIDECYCLLALKRLQLAEIDKNIQGYEDGVFWERNTLAEQVKTKKYKVREN